MKPSFRRLEISSLDQQGLDAFPDRIIYQTLPWISFIAETQNAEPVIAALYEDGEVLGYFTGLVVKKFGFKILGSPFPGWNTPYIGFNLKPGVSRRTAIEALIDFAFNDLNCHHMEFMDRFTVPDDCARLSLKDSMFDSHELDISVSEDQLWRNMRHDCRKCIKKAERSGVVIEQAHDLGFADEYYAQLKHVFAVKNSVPPFGVDRVRRLLELLYPTGNLLVLRARNKEGVCVATGIFPAMNQIVFGWGTASWRHLSQVKPNEMLIWYAIKYWKERGMRVIELVGRGEYKLKYGCHLIAVPWVRKSRNAAIGLLRASAEWTFRTAQHALGKVAQLSERLRKR